MSKIVFAVVSALLLNENITLPQISCWQSIGPWGGKVDDMAIAPNETNVLYARQTLSILKSIDGGQTWTETSPVNEVDNRPVDFLTGITVHPRFSNTAYLGGSATLRRTVDGGRSWEVVIDTIGFVFDQVIFNPQNPNTIYATALDRTIEDDIHGGGISKSTDAGKTWKLCASPLPGNSVADLVISPADTAVLYAVTYQTYPKTSICKSNNAGINWIELDTGIEERVIDLALGASDAATLYAVYWDVFSNRYGMIKTTDAGQNWLRIDSNLPMARIHALEVDRRNSERVYAAIGGFFFDTASIRHEAYGLYLTSNGGQSWQRIATTLEDSLFHDVELDPTHPDTLYLAAEVFGVYASQDGGITWQQRNRDMHSWPGLYYSKEYAISPWDINTVYVIDGSSILRTTDGGISWKRVFKFPRDPIDVAVTIAAGNPDVVYATGTRFTQPRLILRSNDGGETWAVHSDSVLPNENVNLVVDPIRANIVYAFSWRGIFKSIDAGATWTPKNQALTTGLINAITFNRLNPNSLYAATYNKGLFKSVDGGDHWRQVGFDSTGIQAVAIAALDTSLIYTLTLSFLTDFGRLLRSRNAGITWEEVPAPSSAEVSNFIIDPKNPAAIWITTIDESAYISQVFLSTDDGENWTPINDGLPRTEIRVMVMPSPARQSLFALAPPYGLYRLDFATAVHERHAPMPEQTELFQNYPNPFVMSSGRAYEANPTSVFSRTTIAYRLASEGHVELTIHNILGQLIASLVNRGQARGHYRVAWDGRDANGRFVTAGIYFMKLATPHTLRIRKMVLVY